MGKQKKRKIPLPIMLIAIIALAVYLLWHLNLIAFQGAGGEAIGLGQSSTASMSPEIKKQEKEDLSFYFEENKIYHQTNGEKRQITWEEFEKYLQKAKSKNRPVELFLVENITDGFYRKIKELVKEWDVFIRESRIQVDSLEK